MQASEIDLSGERPGAHEGGHPVIVALAVVTVLALVACLGIGRYYVPIGQTAAILLGLGGVIVSGFMSVVGKLFFQQGGKDFFPAMVSSFS